MLKYAIVKVSGYGRYKIYKYNDYINNYSNANAVDLYDCFNDLDIINTMRQYFKVSAEEVKIVK